MGYRRILTHLATDAGDEKRLEAGLTLAHRFNAHLCGVCVVKEPDLPPSSQGRSSSPSFLVETAEHQRTKAAATEAEFHRRCDAANIPGDWILQTGETLQTLAAYSLLTDLSIVSQQPPHGLDDLLSPDRADYLPLVAAGPVLILPREGHSNVAGKNVVIAWKPVRACARAVREASAMLEGAESVTLLIVDPPRDDRDPGGDIAEYLASHGIQARIETRRSHGFEGAGDVILDATRDFGADLLVMGAHGTSRVTEFIFGGATRDVLERMTIPVMMSH